MQYRTGNVSVVNGSPTVTGDTSAWLANVSAGDLFKIVGTGAVYQVASVESNTSLTLTSPFAGSTAGGLLYVIVRDFTPNAHLPLIQRGDIETTTILGEAFRRIDQMAWPITTISSLEDGQALVWDEDAEAFTNQAVVLSNVGGAGISVSGATGDVTITNTGVTNIAGTSSRLTASAATGAVTLDISSSYVGQSSITTLGTITSGIWTGTSIAVANGGTGATSASSARTNLGLVIGTDVPSPTGGGASGTWAINVTGNAATVTGASATAGVANRIVKADASGYIANTYFNSSDNSAGSGVTGVMVKAGDNYYRTGTAAAVAAFISGQTMNIVGNATTATTAGDADTVDGYHAAAFGQLGALNTWSAPNYFVSTGSTASGSGPALEAFAAAGGTNGAYMSFHRSGVYAVNMGLDTDNVFRIGGWSAPANRMALDMSGNVTFPGTVTAGGLSASAVNNFTSSQGYTPTNGVWRMTPNLHLNAPAGYSLILNWDNGGSGTNQQLRVGNGSGADAFYVRADGNTVAAAGVYSGSTATGFDHGLSRSYGSLRIYGRQNGWSGLEFSGSSASTLMWDNDGNGDQQGAYAQGGAGWLWLWKDGTLVNGTVPYARLSGVGNAATYNVDTAGTAGTVALRPAGGYLYATYFNQSSPYNENPPILSVMVQNTSNDGFMRKASLSYFASQMPEVATSTYSRHLWSVSHAGTYYMDVNWDGTYWALSTNHGSPVRAGYADSAGSASTASYAATAPWSGISGAPSVPTLDSGYYTPTLTAGTNVSGITSVGKFLYIRVGNIVTVDGTCTVSYTTNGGTSVFGISLPIASNFGASDDASGGFGQVNSDDSSNGIQVDVSGVADVSNHRVSYTFKGADRTKAIHVHFMYRII